MKPGRPPKEETPYKILIHKNGGKKYASTKVIISESDGKKAYRHKHWGTIDEDNVFHPNRLYLMTEEEERNRLIFPQELDMSETGRLINELKQTKAKKTIPRTIVLPAQTWLYGDVWLLEQVAKGSGLDKDLLTTFKGNREIVDNVLTIAIYLICMDQHLYRLASWQRIEKTPASGILTEDEINNLMHFITEGHLRNLIEQRQNRVRASFGNINIGVDFLIESLFNSLEEMGWNQNLEGTVDIPFARLFLFYTQQLLSGHIHYMWDTTTLRDIYQTPIDILDTMRSIRYNEYEDHPSQISPLDNEQLEICRIFGFEPPVI